MVGGRRNIGLAYEDERFTHLGAVDFGQKGKTKYDENDFLRNALPPTPLVNKKVNSHGFEHCGGYRNICLASKDERTHLAALVTIYNNTGQPCLVIGMNRT